MACDCSLHGGACRRGAAKGLLGALYHAIVLGFSLNTKEVCAEAARGGRLKVVKWSTARGCDWGSSIDLAANDRHLKVTEWCRATDCPWHADSSAKLQWRKILGKSNMTERFGEIWNLNGCVGNLCHKEGNRDTKYKTNIKIDGLRAERDRGAVARLYLEGKYRSDVSIACQYVDRHKI